MQEGIRPRLINELFEKYKYLVYKLISRIDYGYVEREDLIQAGLVGLYKGILKLTDYTNPIKFLSIYINSEIYNELRCNKLVVVSKDIIGLVKKLKGIDYLNKSIDDLSNLLSCSKENVLIALEYMNEINYTNEINLNNSNMDNIDTDISNLKYAITSLSCEERKYIYNRFYLNNTQKQLKVKLNISQSQVSRYEKKLIEKIKKMIV